MILKTGTKGNPKNDVGRITNMLAELQTKLYFIMCAFCALSLISLKRSPSQLSNDKQCLNRDIDGKMDAMIASSTKNFIICHYRYARKSCWNFKLTEKCMKQKTSPIGRGREIFVKDFTLAIYHYFIFDGEGQPLVDAAQYSTRKHWLFKSTVTRRKDSNLE